MLDTLQGLLRQLHRHTGTRCDASGQVVREAAGAKRARVDSVTAGGTGSSVSQHCMQACRSALLGSTNAAARNALFKWAVGLLQAVAAELPLSEVLSLEQVLHMRALEPVPRFLLELLAERPASDEQVQWLLSTAPSLPSGVVWLLAHLSSRYPEIWVPALAQHCVLAELVPSGLLDWLAAQARPLLASAMAQQLHTVHADHGPEPVLRYLQTLSSTCPDAYACCLGGVLESLSPPDAQQHYLSHQDFYSADVYERVKGLLAPVHLVREPGAFVKLLALLLALSGNTKLWNQKHPEQPVTPPAMPLARSLLDHVLHHFLGGLTSQLRFLTSELQPLLMALLPELPALFETFFHGSCDPSVLYLIACIGLCHGGALPAVVMKDCITYSLSHGQLHKGCAKEEKDGKERGGWAVKWQHEVQWIR